MLLNYPFVTRVITPSMRQNGIGVLKPEEVLVGKRVLAERFFRTHKGNLHLFNEIYCQRPERDNVRNLVSHSSSIYPSGLKSYYLGS